MSINERGFWSRDEHQQEHRHAHSDELSGFIIDYLKNYKDSNIIDFGCGDGRYLRDLKSNGFNNLLGIEGDPIPREYVEIIKGDLSLPIHLNRKGVVISLEVGEHIPKEYESVFLDNLSRHCDSVLITSWAIRGQGGYGHVNELNNDEIIPKIENLGFNYDKEASESARLVIKRKCTWFKNTVMIFHKHSTGKVY